MADPLTIGLLVASTAMTAVGTIQQGAAAAAQGRAQQQAQQYNATIKEQNARLARQQAGAREEQQRRGARQVLGQQRAALAQAGIGVGFGSGLDIEEQSAIRAELDSLTIAYEGELQAQGLLAGAQQDIYFGEVAAARGANEQSASYISAGASILSGAAQGAYLRGGGAVTEVATAYPVSGGGSLSPRPI